MRRTFRRATFSVRLVLLVLMSVGGAVVACGPPPPVVDPAGTGPTKPVAAEKMTPPGDCVDPLPDGDKRDATRPFGKHVQLDVRGDDLDGDGEPDIFVKPAWHCGEACNRSVYIARGTCGHYVGTFPSIDRYESMATKTHGLKDLSVRPRKIEADGEMHCWQLILKFDGKEYKQAQKRECECKETDAKCTTWD